MARGFDECGERGVVLIDSENPSNYRFVTLDGRRFNTVSLDISKITDYGVLEYECKRALENFSYKDIVRLELVGKKSYELWLDTKDIESIFSDRFFHFEVRNRTTLSIAAEDFEKDRTLKGEFVRLVYSKKDLDDQTKEKIIATGLYALMGE